MKIAAIYNVWDGVELLYGSMKCLKNEVDIFILVWQDVSNFGERYNPMDDFKVPDFGCEVLLVKYEPQNSGGMTNEILKRNLGLQYAKEEGCTHFLHLDCDEYYEDFGALKQQFLASGAKGSVCKIMTYFKKPTLRLEAPDNYFVPFIHELKESTFAGAKNYPYYVDPTRKIQHLYVPMDESNVVLMDKPMHHYSWVRKDIERKARNSSAKANIERSQLLQDYYADETKAGYYLKDYGQKLVEVDDLFGIKIF